MLPSGSAMSTLMLRLLLSDRHQIGDRALPPIDLAVLQGCRGRGGIGDHHPFDAVDQHPLAAGEPGRRLLPRHVIGELLEYRLGAGHPFALREFHRAGADIFGDLLERIGLRDALRHDEGDWRVVLAQRHTASSDKALQHPFEGPVVDGGQFLLERLEHQPHRIARASSASGSPPRPCASTGSPSWNFSPDRSRKVQVRPSSDTSSDSTIWRCGCSLASMP